MKINKLSRKKKGGVGKSSKSKKTAIKASTTKKKPKLSSNNDERYIYITHERNLSFPYESFKRAFNGYTKADLENLNNVQINEIYNKWKLANATNRNTNRKNSRYATRIRYDSPTEFTVSPDQKKDLDIKFPVPGFTPVKSKPKTSTTIQPIKHEQLFPPFEEELGSKQIADINDLIAELEKNESN